MQTFYQIIFSSFFLVAFPKKSIQVKLMDTFGKMYAFGKLVFTEIFPIYNTTNNV